MSTNLENAFATIGRDMGQALRGRVASLLDFANNTPPAPVALTGAGEAAFEYVSDTQLRLKLRGVDGITRSIVFTVA